MARANRNSRKVSSYGQKKTFNGTDNIYGIKAPSVLSLAKNPEETIAFINKIEPGDKPGFRIYIDMDDVEEVTLDAVLLLLSKIKGKLRKCRRIGGSEPKNAEAREFLTRSGFYAHISHKPLTYSAEKDTGYFKKRDGKRVQEGTARDVIHYANERLFPGQDKRNKGIYRVLIECMANTRDHASIGLSSHEPWWLAVYHDPVQNKVHFTFLDNGVGVFKSTKMKGFIKSLGAFVGILTPVDLLNDILNGKTASRTDIPYRGKGFPAIKTAMDRKFFSNLNIISNNVVLDVETGSGRILNADFKGTCLNWEIAK